ncbi:MAG: Gfo/Idh/MocA family oxidoreductase [Thermoanaerobaculum sp.]|nr:Gfo/Idh/MocA family oxidoreductase [Thermoanaerobaculum sp.]
MGERMAIAVVGVGHLGKHHLRLAATLPFWHCVGAYDTDRAKLETLCGEYGVPTLKSLAQAVELCQVAVVATPTTTHRQVAGAFLEAGRHVLVEKPLASDEGEGQELVELARARRAVLGVGHVEYFNPAVQALLARRPQPKFLEAQRLSPFSKRSQDVDVVLDLMIHDLQILQALNPGAAVAEIRAVGVPVLSAKIDLANVRLALTNGCVACLTASRVSSDRVRKLRVFESRAYYSLDYSEQSIHAFRLDLDRGEPCIVPMPVEVAPGEPLAREHEALANRIRGHGGPFVDGEAGLAALAAARNIVAALTCP